MTHEEFKKIRPRCRNTNERNTLCTFIIKEI